MLRVLSICASEANPDHVKLQMLPREQPDTLDRWHKSLDYGKIESAASVTATWNQIQH